MLRPPHPFWETDRTAVVGAVTRWTRRHLDAKIHIQRVTVMAQAAIDARMEGLDFTTAERLYKAVGVPKPRSWKTTFSNARTAGQVQNVGRGAASTSRRFRARTTPCTEARG
jgi:hypothetical protein